ncbi:MAG: hypothetical protein GY851_14085 [bacterium]|nr:hypothetical protein [bacterium]
MMIRNKKTGARNGTRAMRPVFLPPDRHRAVRAGRPSLWGHKPDKIASPEQVLPLDDDALIAS